MRSFTYDALPGRIVFGVGSVDRLTEEVDRLHVSRVLMIYDVSVKDVGSELVEQMGPRMAGEFTDIQQHVPAEAVERARKAARDAGADCAVTLGGGSTTGFGKVVALEPGIPLIAIPTTYAGSEMTPIYGITSDGQKQTANDIRVLPRTVLYDPALTTSLPAFVTGPSGLNAIAHCVEALYAKDANPITSLMAEEGIGALARGIPASVERPADLEARSEALYGAYLAGAALGVVGMAVHHRICHVLGGTFGLAHGDVNAVVLPYALRYNQDAAPEAMARVAVALGVSDPATGIFDFARQIGAPASLDSLGFRREDLPEVVRLTVESPPWNPRPVEADGIAALLDDAFDGRRPDPQPGGRG
ncbi:MAG: maleylacetate reductase [Actinomycetota bacterium]